MKGMWAEFKAFALGGNMLVLAVGFLTIIVNFLLLALVLFGLVKLLKRAGLGNFRAQGSHECPFCTEFVAIDATKCKWCTADIEPGLTDDEEAVEIATQQRIAE